MLPTRVWGLPGDALDHLAAPGQDAERRVFGIELAGVDEAARVDGEPVVGLRAGHHPVEVEGLAGAGPAPGDAGLAAILDAAAASVFYFDFEFEIEILGDEAVIGDIAVAGGFFLGRFADDGSVFDTPDFGVADPVF